ncbi:MAG: ankyrin repeat domain-containing protein [Acidobacteriota bacterium]|nr:ankyrin repeat domain-containing protein [Acidobacteriota bacterium]
MRASYHRPGWRGLAVLASIALLAVADGRLVDAASDQNLAEVRALLDQGMDVDSAHPDGATALQFAAYRDDTEIAAVLLASGASVDARNELGTTALSLACENGSAELVELLLGAGADPNLALPSGETPLMTAARSGSIGAVRALLERGADVKATDPERGQSALMWAVSESHLEVSRLLVELGAEVEAPSKAGYTPLLFAARHGDIRLAETLLERGAGIDTVAGDGSSALLVATVRGHVELARFLLDRGADPNHDAAGYSALHWASGSWETEMTGPNGIRAPADHEWSAMRGLAAGRLALAEALLAHGADPNARLEKNPPRVGYTVFSLRPKGATPFYLAAMAGDVDVMRALVRHGADPQLLPEDGTSPLMAAAGVARALAESRVTKEASFEAVRLAAELGNDVNAANVRGDTALHGAARIRADAVVQFLIDQGAEVNPQNKRGQTPLFIAERYFHPGSAPLVERTSTGDLLRRYAVPKVVDEGLREWDLLPADIREQVEALLTEAAERPRNPMLNVNPVLPDKYSVPGRRERPLKAATDPPD